MQSSIVSGRRFCAARSKEIQIDHPLPGDGFLAAVRGMLEVSQSVAWHVQVKSPSCHQTLLPSPHYGISPNLNQGNRFHMVKVKAKMYRTYSDHVLSNSFS